MTATTTASPQEVSELAVWLLGHFDSNAILELLREVRPVSAQVYDYEDPGPITDEEIAFCAAQAMLRMDQEEAVYEQSATPKTRNADRRTEAIH